MSLVVRDSGNIIQVGMPVEGCGREKVSNFIHLLKQTLLCMFLF
jgi:hypothetical protein